MQSVVGWREPTWGARPGFRRGLLIVSLAVNLGLLGFFKYYNFFAESAVAFSAWMGLPLSLTSLQIVLPVGISFYTFQTLSYTLDVYRGEFEATRRPLDFALFVAFFPQLVAGPIVRARDFLPQLSAPRRLADTHLRAALLLFLYGFVKKTCVADNFGLLADQVFAPPKHSASWNTGWPWACTAFRSTVTSPATATWPSPRLRCWVTSCR